MSKILTFFTGRWFLGFIIFLAFIVRLYQLTTPLADWHSWRQADTASVAREFTKNGINLLYPRYHDLSNIPSGKDNPMGYRMVEFPLLSGGVAILDNVLNHQLPLHVIYRYVNIILSLFSLVILYFLVKSESSPLTATLTALVFAVLPFNIFFSRTVLPEISLITFSLLSLWLGKLAVDTDRRVFKVIFTLSSAISLLIKPTAIFYLLPIAFYAILKLRFRLLTPSWIASMIMSVLPFLLWRWWIGRFPEGIPSFLWLLNGNNIRFKGSFFFWLFADRLGRMISGYWGLIPLALGFLNSKSRLLNLWFISLLAYLVIFATGNVQHDYYQIILIPAVSVLIAQGLVFLLRLGTYTAYGLAFISFIAMLTFSWYHIRGLYQINNPAIVAAGQAVDQLTPKDAKVIAPYDNDTAFLYQTNRTGWPNAGDIELRINQGAGYYVSTTFDATSAQLAQKYPVVLKTDQFILINLKP